MLVGTYASDLILIAVFALPVVMATEHLLFLLLPFYSLAVNGGLFYSSLLIRFCQIPSVMSARSLFSDVVMSYEVCVWARRRRCLVAEGGRVYWFSHATRLPSHLSSKPPAFFTPKITVFEKHISPFSKSPFA